MFDKEKKKKLIILWFRENKNIYVFSFLSALVGLDIFSTVGLDFMEPGHTGNQVSQFGLLGFQGPLGAEPRGEGAH